MVAIIQLIIMLLVLASYWKIFTMFNQPGWACIVPLYNIIVMLRIVGWDPVKFWFFFIPIYNIYLAIMLAKDLAGKFGKGTIGYALGMCILPFIFLPMLAFKETPVQQQA